VVWDGDGRRRSKTGESLRAAEKRTLEMIADGAGLEDTLNELCRSIEVQAPTTISTILLMGPDGKQLWHAAALVCHALGYQQSGRGRLVRAKVAAALPRSTNGG